jgi:tetratricopeptide (TPR) repeat protein
VAVLVLVVGAGAAWWLGRRPAKPTAAPTTTTAPTTTLAPTTTTQAATTTTAAATTTTSPAPTTTLPRVDTKALQAQAKAREGHRLLARGDLEGAAQAFRQALALKPDLPAAIEGIQKVEEARREKMRQQAAELVARGRDLLAADQLEQARSTFQQALRLDPDAAGAKEGLEAVARRQEELARAEAERKRRQEQQAKAQAALTQGKELLAAGKLKEAEAAFQQALALDPTLEAAREGLEAVRRRQEELARAEAERKREEERRRKVQAAIRQGQALLNAGKLKEAEAAFKQALALDPQAEQAKAGLAEVAKRRAALARPKPRPKPKKPPAPAKPKPRDQQQELRRLARLAFVQGVTDFNAGRYAQAARQFEQFLAVFPDDANGRKYLEMARRQLRESQTGTLVVGCRPVAEVYLDGKKLGITPLVHKGVAVGRHLVEVRAYGARQSRQVEIKPRTRVKLRFQLTGGKLAVNAVPWAEIYFDGRKLGTTPLAIENLPLGPHRLELRRQGYGTVVREVVLEAGKPVRIKVRLTAER